MATPAESSKSVYLVIILVVVFVVVSLYGIATQFGASQPQPSSASWQAGYSAGLEAKLDRFAGLAWASDYEMCAYKASVFGAQNLDEFVEGCVTGFRN